MGNTAIVLCPESHPRRAVRVSWCIKATHKNGEESHSHLCAVHINGAVVRYRDKGCVVFHQRVEICHESPEVVR